MSCSGRRLGLGSLAIAAWTAAACQGVAPGSQLEESRVDDALAPYGVDLAPAPVLSVELGWQLPPADCPHAYRLSVDYEPAQRFEEDNESDLVLGRNPRQRPDAPLPPGPLPEGTVAAAHLFYQGLRAERVGATRDVYLSRERVGPAAPTAACMPRTWDPMEDALALGWPQLTGRLTAVGEAWSGQPVEGKCNRSACVDPQTGGGGPETHDRTCVTPPWHEQLQGVFTHRGELYAWLHSTWSDGHGEGQGIRSERHTLVSVEHGRPLWSRTRIDHRFAQPTAAGGMAPVVRTWTLAATDACPGSLAAAGWERPAALVEREQELRDRLAHVDELRRTPRRRPESPSAGAPPPSGAPSPSPADASPSPWSPNATPAPE